MFTTLLLAAITTGTDPATGLSPELLPPVRVEAAGKPIESGSVGHAAPFVGDFDGDGKPDLLVGQFAGGYLNVYRNEGTAGQPKLAAEQPFKVGADRGVVPAG